MLNITTLDHYVHCIMNYVLSMTHFVFEMDASLNKRINSLLIYKFKRAPKCLHTGDQVFSNSANYDL